MSARPGSLDRAAGVCARLGFWLPLVVCTYLALTPSPPQAVFRVGDVLLHALAFAYLTFALALAHRLRPVALIAAMLLYGVFIEVAQGLGPARTPELKDLLVDCAGIVLGLGAFRLLGAWTERTLRRTLAVITGA